MTYFRRGKVIPATNTFCTWWTWWEYSLNGVSRFIMLWGSIERHFLIFNITLMATKSKRFIFHILPTLITFIYPIIFYFIAVILYSCEQQWNYTSILCQGPCYIRDGSNLFTYEVIGAIVFPVFAIFFANIFLVFRVVNQKRRHHASWRRQRKLTIQLIGIAFLYILFWFPMAIDSLLTTFAPSYFVIQVQINYLIFLVYMVSLFLPFISLAALPELTKKIFRRQERTIRPVPNIN